MRLLTARLLCPPAAVRAEPSGPLAGCEPGGASRFPLAIRKDDRLRTQCGTEGPWTGQAERLIAVTGATMNGVTGRVEGTEFVLSGPDLWIEMTCVPQA